MTIRKYVTESSSEIGGFYRPEKTVTLDRVLFSGHFGQEIILTCYYRSVIVSSTMTAATAVTAVTACPMLNPDCGPTHNIKSIDIYNVLRSDDTTRLIDPLLKIVSEYSDSLSSVEWKLLNLESDESDASQDHFLENHVDCALYIWKTCLIPTSSILKNVESKSGLSPAAFENFKTLANKRPLTDFLEWVTAEELSMLFRERHLCECTDAVANAITHMQCVLLSLEKNGVVVRRSPTFSKTLVAEREQMITCLLEYSVKLSMLL